VNDIEYQIFNTVWDQVCTKIRQPAPKQILEQVTREVASQIVSQTCDQTLIQTRSVVSLIKNQMCFDEL